MKRLITRLGNPRSHFKSVHIAGKKGKGSTAAYLSNILLSEGYYVGCYTSPHMISIRERVSVGRIGKIVGHLSHFEVRNIWLLLGVLWKALRWKRLQSLNSVVQLGDFGRTFSSPHWC